MRSLLTRFSLMAALATMAIGLPSVTAIGATVVPYAPGMYAANSWGWHTTAVMPTVVIPMPVIRGLCTVPE